MASVYQPDSGAKPDATWTIAYLSQRDLSVQIPINLVTHPGVSISKSCFGSNIFENVAAGRCVSNLLAAGFQRFILDIYWNSVRKVWSLCPAQQSNSTSSQGSTLSNNIASATSSTSSSPDAPSVTPRSIHNELDIRQVSASTGTSPGNSLVSSPGMALSAISSSTTSTSSTLASVSQAASSSLPLTQIGQYMCTEAIDLPVFTGVLADYIKQTQTNLGAVATYIVLNLHVASSPSGSSLALDSANLPTQISLVFNANLSAFLYTPTMLKEDRANLNTSWLSSAPPARPDLSYISGTLDAQNQLTTTTGWPSESLIEFSRRLIVSVGQVDPQLQLYNRTRDSEFYFVSEDISVDRNVSFGPSGKLDQGCFMNADNTSKSANSWAVSSQLGFLPLAPQSSTSIPSISNLTACGISPILNETLLGNTADKQIDPYRSVAYSSIWSWSPGEPRNISTTETNNALIRCAAMDSSLNGRWRVADCTERHYAACRSDSDPYSWRLSESKGTYSSGAGDCPKGSSFSVPRTGLENGHLFSVLSRSDVSDTSPLWVNFNSLNRESCWVAGVNSTCPYNPPSASDTRRDVIMPTIAAVIVFAIAALVVFVKCTANRQKYRRARRRKTSDEGGDYEGVPS